MKNDFFTKILLGCFLVLWVCVAGCNINIGCWGRAKVERTDELSAEVSAGSTVEVETRFGSINIKGADTNRCDVIARVSVQAPTKEEAEEIAEKVQIKLEPEGETLKIKVEKPHVGSNRSIGVSFDITVPRRTNIKCGTSFGSVKLADINGDIEAKTSFASIDGKNIQGSVKLETSYGHIHCRNIASGDLVARSSFGGIDIACSDSSPAEMVAKVETSYGSIDFLAPVGFAGEVEAGTSFGAIETELPITVRGDLGQNHVRGTVGQGEGKLYLKTSFGSIKIR